MSDSQKYRRRPPSPLDDELVEAFELGEEAEDYEPFDASELARYLAVHPRTVQRWIARGKLGGHRVGNPHSRLRVRLLDYELAMLGAAARSDRRMLWVMIGGKRPAGGSAG